MSEPEVVSDQANQDAGQQEAPGPAAPAQAMPEGGDLVVIAVDGSGQAEGAFMWYVDHLHRPKNTVVLVHAQEVPSMPTRESWDSQMSLGKSKRQDIVEKYNARFKELAMKGRCVVDMEKPGVLIIDVAKKESAAYIVMGTRGLGKIRRTIMGSVSDFVVHHSHCPVIVCRK